MRSSLELPAPIVRIKGSNAQTDGLGDGPVVAIGQSIRDKFSNGISERSSTWRGLELSVEVFKVFLDFLLGKMGDSPRRLGERVRSGSGALSTSRTTRLGSDYGPFFRCRHLFQGVSRSQGLMQTEGGLFESE